MAQNNLALVWLGEAKKERLVVETVFLWMATMKIARF